MSRPFSAPKGESRSPLTILFTDIVGSSACFAEKGDAAGMAMIERHNSLLFPVVTAAGGRVVKTIGDSIFATFENPGQAVRAAWAMQQTLAAYNQSMAEDQQIRIRIGVHYGLVMQQQADVFGDAVNMAERVKSKAWPGQVLVSRTLRDLLRADPVIKLRSMGLVELKGSPEPIELFELVSAPAPDRADLPSSSRRVWIVGTAVLLAAVVVLLWMYATSRTLGTPPELSTQGISAPQTVARVSLLHTLSSETRELSALGAALSSGDRFQISYQSETRHCLYVAFYDVESQRFLMVFPLVDTLQPLPPGEKILIPGENVRFTLDNQPRTEIVLLIVSPKPLAELDELIRVSQPNVERLHGILQQIKTRAEVAAKLLPGSATQAQLEAVLGAKPAWVELRIEHR